MRNTHAFSRGTIARFARTGRVAVAAAALLLAPVMAKANIISQEVGLTESNMVGSVQHLLFSVATGGNFVIDAEGSATLGAGYNSDPMFFLFNDDGALDAGDLIGSNDDGGVGLNSRLNIFLDIGQYLLAVSEWSFDVSQAVSGIEDSIGDPNTLIRVTLTSQDGEASFNTGGTPVPVPSVLALFGFGLVALGWSRRRMGRRG